MSSVSYQDDLAQKNILRRLAKTTTLLLIALGVYLFSIDFPFYMVFEPQSAGWVFWVSYANDLLQPFAFYFFLCLGERWLKTWKVRALVAITVPVLLEIGQGLYYQFFPRRYIGSFDPLDILMYSISVALAVLLEQRVFARRFKFWQS